MEFCNKGMVQADPHPSYGQRPYFYIFWDPSLSLEICKIAENSDSEYLLFEVDIKNLMEEENKKDQPWFFS